MARIHFTGNLPVNDHERRAVKYFESHLPDHWDIYPNVERSDGRSLPAEYDQIIVGDYAVYCVEVKGWGGRIEGGKYQWQLLASGDFKDSPIGQNSLKAKKLKSVLMSSDLSLRGILTDSIIVLTDDRAEVSLKDEERWRVMHLHEAVSYMLDYTRLRGHHRSLSSHRTTIANILQSNFHPRSARPLIGGYALNGTPLVENKRFSTVLASNMRIQTQKNVLLKVYHADIYGQAKDREIQQRLNERDANALLQMSPHPNIVRVFHAFPWDHDKYILVLEYIESYTLRSLLDLDRVGNMSFAEKVGLIRQVGAALQHAHQHGVIHRNVQPQNVFVPGNSLVRLGNFDFAHVDSIETIGANIISYLDARYTALEVQKNPHQASPLSDQYALGVVFFELLSGQCPVPARTQDIFQSVMHGAALSPTLGKDVSDIITRMCQAQPQQRYDTMNAVLEDLEIIV